MQPTSLTLYSFLTEAHEDEIHFEWRWPIYKGKNDPRCWEHGMEKFTLILTFTTILIWAFTPCTAIAILKKLLSGREASVRCKILQRSIYHKFKGGQQPRRERTHCRRRQEKEKVTSEVDYVDPVWHGEWPSRRSRTCIVMARNGIGRSGRKWY